jgi:hypothetical protein
MLRERMLFVALAKRVSGRCPRCPVRHHELRRAAGRERPAAAETVDLRPRLTPGQSEEQRKRDLALISGEMDALNRVRSAKKC